MTRVAQQFLPMNVKNFHSLETEGFVLQFLTIDQHLSKSTLLKHGTCRRNISYYSQHLLVYKELSIIVIRILEWFSLWSPSTECWLTTGSGGGDNHPRKVMTGSQILNRSTLNIKFWSKGQFTGCLHMLSSSLMFTGEQSSNNTIARVHLYARKPVLTRIQKRRRRRWVLPVRDDGDPTGVEGFEGKLLLVWSGE